MIWIDTCKAAGDLAGRSKWWGFPDLPESLDWPSVEVDDDGDVYDDPLTFVGQIRCADIAGLDPEGLLPHEGMLYFFAALDYFLGDLDAAVAPGMGEWPSECFRVLYSPSCEGLNTHSLLYDDGTPACLPAEEMVFRGDDPSGLLYNRLLGAPSMEETREAMPGLISLFQLDENDDWDLRFFDSGMLNFLMTPSELAARRFDAVRAWLFSA